MLYNTVTKHGNNFAHKPQHWAYLNTSSLEHTPLYCQSTSRQPFVLQKSPSSHNLRKEIFHRGMSTVFHSSWLLIYFIGDGLKHHLEGAIVVKKER